MRQNHIILFAAALAGLILADIDQKIPFLVHRSIITHGFLMTALLLFLIVRHQTQEPEADGLRLFTIGYSLATAVHLCFDLFPRGWYGHALIHIPFVSAGLPPVYTIAWITASILVCLYAAFFLIKDMPEFILSLVVLGLVFWLAAITEKVIEGRAIILPAGGVLVVGTLIAMAIPHRFFRTHR